MSDERLEESGEALQRSASAMIFQGAEAFGAAATGLGALAAGAAQWKDSSAAGTNKLARRLHRTIRLQIKSRHS
jgi:hypothetical protein